MYFYGNSPGFPLILAQNGKYVSLPVKLPLLH